MVEKYLVCYYCEHKKEFKEFRPTVIGSYRIKGTKLICYSCQETKENRTRIGEIEW